MRKIIAYPLSVLYTLLFGLTLLVFDPIQRVSNRVFGYSGLKRTVSFLNFFLIKCNITLGTRHSFNNLYKIPKDTPLIIVANHQSMHDIPPIIWHMRAHHPKFVSKIELGKGIPSVSYNLRYGGSVLIDRKDPKQALREIAKLGTYIEEHKRSAVIFPEGTRSKTGKPKKFQTTGLKLLLKKAPSALIIPISINDSWKIHRYGKFPYGIGTHVIFDVHKPIKNEGNLDKLITEIEQQIKMGVTSF